MRALKILFENNQRWVSSRCAADPEFFTRMAKGQNPKYMWLGCSDSRIPANEVVGLDPGELYVHRNVANLFLHTDFNCQSVLEYGVESLGIEHIIVCGHYGCGGVHASMGQQQHGLLDNWLRNIRDVYARFGDELDGITDKNERCNRLVELNVIQQVMNICYTTTVQNAWARKQPLYVHGWVYELSTGRLKDLDCCISGVDQVERAYRMKRASNPK